MKAPENSSVVRGFAAAFKIHLEALQIEARDIDVLAE